jgi:hypothetical protein
MAPSDDKIWHARLVAWFAALASDHPAAEYEVWAYLGMAVAGACYLGLAVAATVVINLCALPCGVYAGPAWRADARLRLLTFKPGGLPIIAVAGPCWVALALWRAWVDQGAVYALGPFLATPLLALVLVGGLRLANRSRARR